jgi:hypothetical protein
MNTTIVVAVIGAVGAIGAVVLTPVIARLTSRKEVGTEDAAVAVIREMLTVAEEQRSFARIKARLGGFTDQDLRKLLVRAGAIRYTGPHDLELWGLRDRNKA